MIAWWTYFTTIGKSKNADPNLIYWGHYVAHDIIAMQLEWD